MVNILMNEWKQTVSNAFYLLLLLQSSVEDFFQLLNLISCYCDIHQILSADSFMASEPVYDLMTIMFKGLVH